MKQNMWPTTEVGWMRFKERYNRIVTRVARKAGIQNPEDVDDVTGIFWNLIFCGGYKEMYDPTRGPLEGFLVALAKTVSRNFHATQMRHAKRITELSGAESFESDDETGTVEFDMLLDRASQAVSTGKPVQRKIWDGLLSGDTRGEIMKRDGISKSYVSLMVSGLRRVSEVRDLLGCAE